MNKIALDADKRSETGKGPARRLRAAGKIPAVFYGSKTEPIHLAVDRREFKKSMDQAGANVLFDLKIKDAGKGSIRTAILKERQTKPADGAIVHLDFVEIFKDVAIEVTVPLEFVGKSKGIEKGGLLEIAARQVLVSCLPGDIPATIQVDVSEVDLGHTLHVGDIVLPRGVELRQDPALAVATVVTPSGIEAPAPPEEAAEVEGEQAPPKGTPAES
ncbi:MAG: 50S ribosomal protein L25 [Thermodesulfobacteriota bacterium]